MDATAPTDQIIAQGRAPVCAIEAFGVIEPSNWFERTVVRTLQAVYKRRLRAIVGTAPAWTTEQILSASEHVGYKRSAISFVSNN